ncbi:MAG: DUF4302 domain-containing protein [Alistipes sp.]|nr:DUF4302 domain-containing protein [Alistipes sp.]
MKKLLYIILAGLAAAFCACGDSDEAFDLTASQRMDKAVERYRFALLASERWVMEYFPDEELNYGGWVYVIEFHADNTLKAWFEGSTFITGTPPVTESNYAVEFSTGPMLKFTTHNDFLHFFSFPGANGAGYEGYKGDYEFTIMEMSPAFDEIIMRGIKTGNRIRLTPLSGEYTPESYIETVRADQQSVKRTKFRVTANGEEVATIERANAIYPGSFTQYAASKIWTISYAYDEPLCDIAGNPMLDGNGERMYETIEVNDRISVINLPGNVMQIYEPYAFRGDVIPMLKGQTMRTFQWQLGATSSSDCFVCTDSFFDFKLIP